MNPQLGIIFDMDGVLVQSYQPHLASWQQTAAKHGLELTEPQFASTFGKTSREIIRLLWPDRFDDAGVAAFDAEKEAAYRQILATHFPEMPGAGNLIAALHAAGFLLAIGSSGPPQNVDLVHRNISHSAFITATVNGMEVKHGKPDPDVFLLAAKKLSLSPAHCAVIEDAPVGIQAARRANMLAIGLTSTVPRATLFAAGAHHVVDSLSSLTPQSITSLILSPPKS